MAYSWLITPFISPLPMHQCLLLNYPWDGQNPLFSYIRRTGYLTVSQAGALTDELAQHLRAETCEFVFLHLSAIDEPLPILFLDLLRQQQDRLIITSPFPRQLHPSLGLEPLAYLTEPYPFDRFQKCMEPLIRQNENQRVD
jgi:hypothetical protein